jgi:hypothetical protein
MSTELEQRLRTDMERFTRGVTAPSGLAQKAHRHNQRRRAKIRIATAAGSVTVLAAGAVTAAGVTGQFGAAPPARQTQTRATAYVLSRVERALAPANVDNLISYSRAVYPPGMALEPVPGGLAGPSGSRRADSLWAVGYLLHWAYGTSQRFSAYTASGQHVFDMGIAPVHGIPTQTAVIYLNRTWWTRADTQATGQPGQSGQGGCVPTRIRLDDGAGAGWPAFIRSQLSCGAYAVTGHQVVDGVDALKITDPGGQITLLVNPRTYLPMRLAIGPIKQDFQWLAPTVANLAPLKVSVPAGFGQVTPPDRPGTAGP